MLELLHIENIAIIDRADITFEPVSPVNPSSLTR